MSMTRKSRPLARCEGCGAELRAHQLVRWIRWSDGVLNGPACLRCVKFNGPRLYDRDGQLVAYTFTAPLDEAYPMEVPIGSDPERW